MPAEDGIKSKLSVHSSGFNENKAVEKINIQIKKCKNLFTTKLEGLTIYAKIDFNENLIAESQKITVTTADAVSDLNFMASLSVNPNDQTSLDDLAYKPIIITLIEVLPKEKKQKEEKVQTFGQTVFDLYQIIKGETNISLKLPVYATPGSTLENQSADLPLPELEVNISVEQPILNPEEFKRSNILTVTLESMYALPDAWNNNAKEYAYSVSLPIPLSDDKDNAVTFVNGLVKSTTDPINKQKRWPDTRGILTPTAVYIPQSYIGEDQNGEEQGDFQSKEDKEYRYNSEKEKPKIVWNVERRCFLNNQTNNALRDQLMKARYLPIEIIRTLVPTGAKGKKDEDLSMSYHGVAYIDMAPLLYPGATQIKGAFKVVSYSDSEYLTKTRRKTGLVDETLKVVNYLFDRNFAIMPIKKEINKVVEKKDNKKNPRESNIDGHDISQSVAQLLEAKSFIVIEIKFDKPLIPRKPFDVLAKRVSELIPPRPKYAFKDQFTTKLEGIYPVRTNSAEKAVNDYYSQIKTILYSVLDDYRNLSFDDSNEFLNSDSFSISKKETELESRRRKLLYDLNSTGKYFAFKEQLKNSVVKIVREKFLKTSALSDPEQLHQFLSELYVFLIDELHKALNGILAIEDTPLVETNLTDRHQMKHFALEAEMNRNFDLAAYYYQERIAIDKNNFDSWLDYAVFNLLIEDYSRCEECLKECVSINQNEIAGLLLYSVICAMQEKYDLAETFLEKVTAQESDNIIGWTLLSILYEQKGQELNAEITLKKTLKLNQNILNEANNMNASLNQLPVEMDLEASIIKRDEEGTIEEDNVSKAQASDIINKSRTSKRGTIPQLPKTKSDNNKSPKLGGASAKNLENQSHLMKEKLSNETAMINKSIFLRTARFLIKYNAFSLAEKCMAKELVNPSGGPNSQYHILLAKIKLAKNQLEEAEKHITESLSFDYQNSQAWILWGHVRYLLGDFKDAKEKYERVLLFPDLPNDQTHSIYIRLASIYLKEENYEDSKRLFLYPCKHTPSCMSWLGVGICCYRLAQLEEAKNALCEANILNNKAPEVWAYLSLICLRTNKPLEAEQAYKYSMKLNLDNPELLEEIHILQEKVGFGNPEF